VLPLSPWCMGLQGPRADPFTDGPLPVFPVAAPPHPVADLPERQRVRGCVVDPGRVWVRAGLEVLPGRSLTSARPVRDNDRVHRRGGPPLRARARDERKYPLSAVGRPHPARLRPHATSAWRAGRLRDGAHTPQEGACHSRQARADGTGRQSSATQASSGSLPFRLRQPACPWVMLAKRGPDRPSRPAANRRKAKRRSQHPPREDESAGLWSSGTGVRATEFVEDQHCQSGVQEVVPGISLVDVG
jgi:hypothetical protein